MKTLNKKNQKKGQSLIEYALIVSVAAMVVVTMSTYVYRAVQSKQQTIIKESQK